MKRILTALGLAATIGVCPVYADSPYGGDYGGFGITQSTTYGSSGINAVVTDIYDNHDNPQLIGQRMTINLQPSGASVGQPTAYYVGIGINNAMAGMYTATGWKKYTSGMYEPVAIGVGGGESFTILDGSQTICQAVAQQVFQNGGGFNMGGVGSVQFYAGYGYVSPDKQSVMQNLYSQKATTVPQENMQLMFAQSQMMQSQTYQQVYSVDCSTGN
ncbi:MAG: hypothetical protein B7Y07_08125 [Halothiobacillus sp. 24-54-40]|jgi:hypothetical protein|nr:MAG: hypothetical protein B7Y58_06425 [Halothiobacillus sp. 35-54-62]OYY56866.1 MAG: hypothetical protein B7Y53_00850 [Halothiobacillus sp. 28-55-5]OYZ86424.1 MAG: hypothetical protein B7Y07_08125 [Halothiobacillus sp. 24-54-40]OZA80327.1 MAG: hypothetical protein B7X64_06355 [Halothiobacillus sp. 39-53-45]HQS03173.1 hypothetical protein [Halothiobacillus sp.]